MKVDVQALYENWMPKYLQVQPAKIRMTILYRFLLASVLCFVLDYLLLAMFLCLNFFDVRRPSSSLGQIFLWTFFSIYTSVIMLIIRAGTAGYGWLLCNIHYSDPVLHRNRRDRFADEWPLLFRMLSTLLFIAAMTSLLWASFVDTKETGYLHTCGLLCGVTYFVKSFEKDFTRFPMPMMQIKLHEAVINLWWRTLKRSGREAFSQTLRFSPIYWYLAGRLGCTFTQTGLHFQGWLLSTLILTKLHMVRKVYALVMQGPLPLIIDSPQLHENPKTCLFQLVGGRVRHSYCTMQMVPSPRETQVNPMMLPLFMVLSAGRIHGFRLLAAREFYAAMSGKLCKELFVLKDVKNIHSNWKELRDIVISDIKEFLVRLQNCIQKFHPKGRIVEVKTLRAGLRPEVEVKTPRAGLRPLVKPSPKKLPIWRTARHEIPKPIEWYFLKSSHYFMKALRLFLVNKLIGFKRHLLEQLPAHEHLRRYFYEEDVLAELNHELRCGEHLVWTLQGLVCVFMRSLKEDRYGVVQGDLPLVFETLHKLEDQLNVATLLIHKHRCNCVRTSAASHELLVAAVKRCQCRMLVTFGPHLDFILGRCSLKKTLEERMEVIF
ncbi:hypothetical protein KR074_011107 [Drosophila pseudoananassae]|nr:hypothetical protein KR074_011107 [Drosophila pseudoananassae]